VNPAATLRRHGFRDTARLYWTELCYRYACIRTRSRESYHNPTPDELVRVEGELIRAGVDVRELAVDAGRYHEFTSEFPFPVDYHGGAQTGYWHEKIFEHQVSHLLLGIDGYGADDVYLDVAAGGSPWVRMLRELRGVTAYAIDLTVRHPFRELGYYREEDATRTTFASASVRGISLHCAYEMFTGNSDVQAISEISRILAPGGAVVIVPLYLHTHYCCYSSPEFWGKGFADDGAREYVRRGTRGIPSSRKYDAARLCQRVIDPAVDAGLEPVVYVLRNQYAISAEIYCHFVLMLRKPYDSSQ